MRGRSLGKIWEIRGWVVSVTQAFPGRGMGLSSAQETGENRTAVPEAVTMSMPLSEPSVS